MKVDRRTTRHLSVKEGDRKSKAYWDSVLAKSGLSMSRGRHNKLTYVDPEVLRHVSNKHQEIGS